MFPELTEEEIEYVVERVSAFFAQHPKSANR
jgi:hypothetical protein